MEVGKIASSSKKKKEKRSRRHLKKTTRTETRSKTLGKRMNLDDKKIWEEFETEKIDDILEGKIQPKNLITTCHNVPLGIPGRGPLIANMLLSVFPNSTYIDAGLSANIHKIIRYAKKKGYTSLILAAHSYPVRHDVFCIISLLNGAAAHFRIFDLVPRELIPERVDPPSLYPFVLMKGFTSTLDVGISRLIQSLFPKVLPCDKTTVLSLGFSTVKFLNYHTFCDHTIFRHFRFHFEEDLEANKGVKIGSMQDCGPRFTFSLIGVEKITV